MGAFAYLFLPNLPQTVTETKENTLLIYHYCNISDCLIGYKRSTKKQDNQRAGQKSSTFVRILCQWGGGGVVKCINFVSGGGGGGSEDKNLQISDLQRLASLTHCSTKGGKPLFHIHL